MTELELGVKAGDTKNIDKLKRELKEKGYKADYENLWSGTTGFWSVMTVEHSGEKVKIFVEGMEGVRNLIKEVRRVK